MLRYSPTGIAAALLHLLILGANAYRILGSVAPDWPSDWTIFLALDFPVSLGVIPVTWIAPPASGGPLRDVTNFWWPLLYHGTIGTLWWYIVGWAIERRIWRQAPDDAPGEEPPAEHR
jgi:hypothetical protein